MNGMRVLPAGDSALLLRLGDTIDPAINARALRIASAVREAGERAVRDVVVGYASVTVYFAPLQIEAAAVEALLGRAASASEDDPDVQGRRVTIPAVYGGESGPDLGEVAAFAGCSEEEVIGRHLAREYRVFMLGFLPGFPYLALVDGSIAMPRRDSPRTVVPAGSVGIAGRQTGIYPVQSPGGWRLIGRTTLSMFDASRTPPALLQPGDLVRFERA